MHRWKTKAGLIILEICMLLASLLIIIPILIMLLGSVKTPAEAQAFSISLPTEWKFDNYLFVIKSGGIAVAMKNSFIITASTILVCVIFAALCAFFLARMKSRYSSAVYQVFLLGMIAPMQIITTYGLLKVLHIMGTYLAVILIITAVQLPWTVFIFSSFIKGVPREMDEAAFIDGCGPLRMFFSIILPLLKPVLATTVVTVAMSAWNEFMIPLYFFNTSSKWTMPLTVYNFFGQYFANWNYVFADLVLTALPVTLLYLYCQKYIIAGMTAGAVKG